MANRESGVYGTLTVDGVELTPLLGWTRNLDPHLEDWVDNTTAPWGTSKKTFSSMTGTITVGTRPSFDEGDEVALVLYSENQYTLTFDAVIGAGSHDEDIQGGSLGTWEFEYRSRGTVLKSTGSGP